MNRRTTAVLMIAATVLFSGAITVLGSVFEYPDILKEPAADPAVAHAAEESFTTAHQLLGTVVGETFGYLLTAVWTLLVVATVARTLAGRWFQVLGGVSAVLVLSGVLSPLELPGIDLANLVGYILWGAWLIAFGVLLLRRPVKKPARNAVAQQIPASPLTAKVR